MASSHYGWQCSWRGWKKTIYHVRVFQFELHVHVDLQQAWGFWWSPLFLISMLDNMVWPEFFASTSMFNIVGEWIRGGEKRPPFPIHLSQVINELHKKNKHLKKSASNLILYLPLHLLKWPSLAIPGHLAEQAQVDFGPYFALKFCKMKWTWNEHSQSIVWFLHYFLNFSTL